MFGQVLRETRRLDDFLSEKFGRPYHAVLGVGLIVEIVARLRELHENAISWTSVTQ